MRGVDPGHTKLRVSHPCRTIARRGAGGVRMRMVVQRCPRAWCWWVARAARKTRHTPLPPTFRRRTVRVQYRDRSPAYTGGRSGIVSVGPSTCVRPWSSSQSFRFGRCAVATALPWRTPRCSMPASSWRSASHLLCIARYRALPCIQSIPLLKKLATLSPLSLTDTNMWVLTSPTHTRPLSHIHTGPGLPQRNVQQSA